jgi:hypothetical protein
LCQKAPIKFSKQIHFDEKRQEAQVVSYEMANFLTYWYGKLKSVRIAMQGIWHNIYCTFEKFCNIQEIVSDIHAMRIIF